MIAVSQKLRLGTVMITSGLIHLQAIYKGTTNEKKVLLKGGVKTVTPNCLYTVHVKLDFILRSQV